MDIVFCEDPRDFARRDWSALVDGRPGRHVLPHAGLPEAVLGGVRRDARPPAARVRGGEDGEQVGAVAFERIGGDAAVPRRHRGHRLHGTRRAARGAGRTSRRSCWAALARTDDWTEADLRGLPEDQRVARVCSARRLRRKGSRPWRRPRTRTASRRSCRCPERGTSTSKRLPAKLRHEIKRKARKLEAEAGPCTICRRPPRRSSAFLDRFVELHRTSEGPKGVFMQPGMEIFFRRLGEAFLPRGIFRLTFIEAAEHRSCAGTIGFRFGGTYFLYNSAFDRDVPARVARAWCSWPRTSASRSRTGARRSTC